MLLSECVELQVTDAPEIHSNGFHVKFDITEDQIGFLLPTVISPCDMDMFKQLLSGEDLEDNHTSWNTCIILPFRSKFVKETNMSSIISHVFRSSSIVAALLA